MEGKGEWEEEGEGIGWGLAELEMGDEGGGQQV
jgi:hypothetical protein